MNRNFNCLVLAGGMLAGLIFAGCATVPPESQAKVELQRTAHYSDVSGSYYTVSEVDQLPRPQRQVPPIYPRNLMSRGISGYAVLVLVIETDGRISECLVKSATQPAFGEAARQAALQWRFSPALKDGVPVRCAMEVPLAFSVDNLD